MQTKLIYNLALLATLGALGACNNGSSAATTSSGALRTSDTNVGWVNDNYILVADTGRHVLRVVDRSSGNISTMAGTDNTPGFSPDGTSPALTLMHYPVDAILDGPVAIFTNTEEHCVQLLDSTEVQSIAGVCGDSGDDGDGSAGNLAHLQSPTGLCLDSHGDVYIADSNAGRIRKVDHNTFVITTYAGNGTSGYDANFDGGSALLAPMTPTSCSFDASDNLYFTSNNEVIEKVSTDGIITLVAGNGSNGYAGDDGLAVNAQVNRPLGVSVDQSKNFVYFSDHQNYRVRKVDLNTGIISTFAGNGSYGNTGDGASALSAEVAGPGGLAVQNSDVYIATDGAIRKVDSNGNISTVVGTGVTGNSGDSGPATDAQIQEPYNWSIWAD